MTSDDSRTANAARSRGDFRGAVEAGLAPRRSKCRKEWASADLILLYLGVAVRRRTVNEWEGNVRRNDADAPVSVSCFGAMFVG